MLHKLKAVADRYEALISQLEDPAIYQEPARLAKLTREQKKELRANGVNRKDKEAVAAYFAAKAEAEAAAAAAKAAEEAEKARLDREANPTTEDLLKLILAELKKD